jgi:hypothetical protein
VDDTGSVAGKLAPSSARRTLLGQKSFSVEIGVAEFF